ncbi:MAG: hypothetical protein ACI3YC_06495 [Alloprevotella sp.]
MKKENKTLLLFSSIETLLYLLSAPLIYFTDLAFGGQQVAMQQVPFIMMVTLLFFIIAILTYTMHSQLLKSGGKKIMMFYLVGKVGKILLTLTVFIIYAIAVKNNLIFFTGALAWLYLIGLIITTLYFSESEKQQKQTK